MTLILLFNIVVLMPIHISAFDRDEHDEYLEKVLFGAVFDSNTMPESEQEILRAIEDASYLTLDQFNGAGTSELMELKSRGISGLPATVGAIDFKSNQYHRKYTHCGWNYIYVDDKAHWETRKGILLQTINTEFDFSEYSLSNALTGYDDRCDGFSAIIYYTHVLGDIIHDNKYLEDSPIDLGGGGEHNKNTVIDELIKYSDDTFGESKFSPKYIIYKVRLNNVNRKVKKLFDSDGGIDTDEENKKYILYANETMNLMINYIPSFLAEEDFFAEQFSTSQL